MKKTVLAILAGMVCAISFACISGGGDYSGEGGNLTGTESLLWISGEGVGDIGIESGRVYDVNYLAFYICSIYGLSRHSCTRIVLRGAPNKTLVYIAEVNGENHVESPSFSNNDGSVSFSSTIYNRKTVHLPLRVKVGLVQAALPVGREKFFVSTSGENFDNVIKDFCQECRVVGGKDRMDQRFYQPHYERILSTWRREVRNIVSDFSLLLQYQIAGSSSWTTVSRTSFSDIQQQVFQWQKSSEGVQISKPKYYFLNGKIDGDFPAGTTLLIRIVAESIKNYSPTNIENSLSGWQSFPEKSTWTKQMTSTSFTKHGDFQWDSVEIYNHILLINGFSAGLNTLYSLDDETGDLNWCPLQWMAVTIGEGRKPE